MRNFTASVIFSDWVFAIQCFSRRGSHSVPGIGICVGTGASPCSSTGGTRLPPWLDASGMPASRLDR